MADQLKYTQKLKGDKVLVVGGSSGLGYCVAEALLENDCTVIISSSNPSRVEKAVKKLQGAYPSKTSAVTGHACGLGDEETLESDVAALFEKVGKLDHVVITAGDSLQVVPLSDVSVPQIKKTGMVRFFAPLIIAKHAQKYLSPGPKSSITLSTGAVSQRPIANWTVVASFATGLHGMTRGLALDMAPIRVNLVSPGAVDTELWDGLTAEQKKGMMDDLVSKLPTKHIATPEEVQ